MAMDDFGKEYYRKEETILKDFTNRQNAIIKALTEENDMCEFRNMCEQESLFDKINELPTVYEVVTSNGKNQKDATEQAKKGVEDKSTVSDHCKAFSNSEVEQQGMSSSILVKDLKREGKKAITK